MEENGNVDPEIFKFLNQIEELISLQKIQKCSYDEEKQRNDSIRMNRDEISNRVKKLSQSTDQIQFELSSSNKELYDLKEKIESFKLKFEFLDEQKYRKEIKLNRLKSFSDFISSREEEEKKRFDNEIEKMKQESKKWINCCQNLSNNKKINEELQKEVKKMHSSTISVSIETLKKELEIEEEKKKKLSEQLINLQQEFERQSEKNKTYDEKRKKLEMERIQLNIKWEKEKEWLDLLDEQIKIKLELLNQLEKECIPSNKVSKFKYFNKHS